MTSPASTTDPTHTASDPTASTPTTSTPATSTPAVTTSPTVTDTASPAPTVGSGPADRATAKAETTPRARRALDVRAGARRAASLTAAGVARLRTVLGELVFLVCLLAATALLLGVVLVALEANTRNALVEAVLRAADWADLGVFSRSAGVKEFTGEGAVVKNAVVNWGLGAVAWLIVGRLVRRILIP